MIPIYVLPVDVIYDLSLGVFDALEKKYLRLLLFGIHDEKDDLIEASGKFCFDEFRNVEVQCYNFQFAYGEESAQLDVSHRSGNGMDTTKSQRLVEQTITCTKASAKEQTLQLIRSVSHRFVLSDFGTTFLAVDFDHSRSESPTRSSLYLDENLVRFQPGHNQLMAQQICRNCLSVYDINSSSHLDTFQSQSTVLEIFLFFH